MDKSNPKFNTGFNPALSQASRFIIKTNLPPKKLDETIINQFFQILDEGKYKSIYDFIKENNLVVNVTTETGESPLHRVINSTNINNQDKLSLVQFLLDLGAPIISFDKNNITPLHLACKNQLYEIVTLLLKYGANPNVQDSNNMNPMHYTVIGKTVNCSILNEKEPEIIPQISKKKEDSNLLNNIVDDFSEILFKSQLNKYMKNIHNTIISSNLYYFDEYNIIETKLLKEFDTILQDSNLSIESKKIKIEEQKTKYIIELTNLIKAKFGKSLTLVSLEKYDKADGFTPDDNKKNILFAPTSYLLKNSIKLTDKLVREKITNLQTSISNINSENETIFNNLKDIKINTGKLIWLNRTLIYNNSLIVVNPPAGHNTPIINNLHIKESELMNTVQYSTSATGPITGTFVLDNINLYGITQEDLFVTSRDTLLRGLHNEDYKFPKITNAEFEELKKTNTRITKNNHSLTYESTGNRNLTTLQKNNGIIGYIVFPFSGWSYDDGTGTIINTQNLNNSEEFTFSTIPLYLNKKIKEQILIISKNIKALDNYYSNEEYYVIYVHIIPFIITCCYNVILNLILLEKYSSEAKTRVKKISEMLDELKIIVNRTNNFKQLYLIESLESVFNTINSKTNEISGSGDSTSNQITQLFTKIIDLLQKTNAFSDAIADKMGYKYLELYHNNLAGDYIFEPQTEKIRNIFSNKFMKLEIPSGNFNSFIEKLNELNKNILIPAERNDIYSFIIEKYFPQIDYQNYLHYFASNLPDRSIGIFNPLNQQLNNGTINIYVTPDGGGFKSKNTMIGFLGYSTLANIGINPVDNKPNLRYDNNNNSIEFLDINDDLNNLSGIIGFKKTGRRKENKSNRLIKIASNCISIHYSMIKNIILESLLKLVEKFISNQDLDDFTDPYLSKFYTTNPAIQTEMNTIFKRTSKHVLEYIDYLKQTNIDVNDKIIYIKIMNLIDGVLINFINKEAINYATIYSFITLSKLNRYTGKTYSDIITPLIDRTFYKNHFVILKEESLIDPDKVNLNEILELVKDESLSTIDFDVKLLMDKKEVSKYKNINIIKKVSQYDFTNLKSIDESCYKVDSRIIEKLKEYKINLDQKDNSGRTPIIYAIDNQNTELIKLLLDGYSTSTNKNNTTKIYLKNKLIEIIKYNNNFNSYISNLNTNLMNSLSKNTNIKFTILESAELVMPMLILMLNHNIYLKSFNYFNGFNKYNDLANYFNMRDISEYSILEKIIMEDSVTSSIINKGRNVNEFLDYYVDEIKKLELILSSYNESKVLMTTEKDDVNTPITRKSFIDGEIKTVDEKITNSNRKLSLLVQKRDYLLSLKGDTSIISEIKKNTKLSNKIYRNPVYFYEHVLKNIINKDNKLNTSFNIKLFIDLFKQYIKNINENKFDKTNIVLIMDKFILDNNDSINLNEESIRDYFTKVIKPITTDLFELPQEYNDTNYILKENLDILTFVLSNTVFLSLLNAIAKLIYRYVNETAKEGGIGKEKHEEYLLKLTQNILNFGKDDKSYLYNHILLIMPRIYIKKILNIYDGNNDPDSNNNIDNLYEQIVNILTQNTIYPISNDSVLITNFKNHLFPYFKIFNETCIKESYKVIGSYNKYLKIQSDYVSMYNNIFN